MIPNLDFIRTMLDGLRESVFARIRSAAAGLEQRISAVDAKIHAPDYEAAAGEPGHILNKPVLVGRLGAGEYSEIFNNYENNTAAGTYAHAEGYSTTASGRWGSHAEGFGTVASGARSHAEGDYAVASGMNSHAEGTQTVAASKNQHAQGKYNVKDSVDKYVHIVGNGTADIVRSNAHTLDWAGNAWFAGSVLVGGTGQDDGAAVPLLSSGEADMRYAPIDAPVFTGSVSMGRKEGSTVGDRSCAMGKNVTAAGVYAHAEGDSTSAVGDGSHAEGYGTTAGNPYAHAEGRETTAGGANAHAEGLGTSAGGAQSHAEGRNTVASGSCAHAEGQGTQAVEGWTHAEGYNTTAGGSAAHAEGNKTEAKGFSSHAEGLGTIAADYQHVQGKYNVEDTAYKYAHIVGNGKTVTNDAGETEVVRSNAHTLDWNGNAWFAGSLEGTALILKTSGGKYFRLSVDDAGALKIEEVLR